MRLSRRVDEAMREGGNNHEHLHTIVTTITNYNDEMMITWLLYPYV
jgi:hypothetical protein